MIRKKIGYVLKNKYFKWIAISAFSSLHILLFCTLTDFLHVPVSGILDYVVVASHLAVIAVPLFCLLFVVSINKYSFTVFYSLLAVASSILAYYRYTLNFSLNPLVLDIGLAFDVRLGQELLTWGLGFWVLLNIVISSVIIYFRFRINFVFRRRDILLLMGAVFVIYYFTQHDYRFANPINNRIPFNIYGSLSQYAKNKKAISAVRPEFSESFTTDSDTLTVVLILGESLRPMNLGVNGYHRNTTPRLSELDNLVSYPNVYTKQTYTNISIPYILTRADSISPQLGYTERSFISIFNALGFETYCVSNQDVEATYSYFINETKHRTLINSTNTVYNYNKWLDGDILPYYKEILEDKSPKKLIVLHTIGSHWWYNNHFDDQHEVFKPVLKSKLISSCDSMEIVNSYDNTVLYTDYFINEVVKPLQNSNSFVYYISDHGELLGENNLWLHAQNSGVIERTAAMFWASDSYIARNNDKWNNIKENRNIRWDTDFVFHSILDISNIQSEIIDTTRCNTRVVIYDQE